MPDVLGLCLTDGINILKSLQRLWLNCSCGGFSCLLGGGPLREEIAVSDPDSEILLRGAEKAALQRGDPEVLSPGSRCAEFVAAPKAANVVF